MLLAHGFDLPVWCGAAIALPFGKAVVYYAVLRGMGARSTGRELSCAVVRTALGIASGVLAVMVALSFGVPWLFPIPLWVLRAFAWGFAWQGTARTARGTATVIALGLVANLLVDLGCWLFLGFGPGLGVIGHV